MRALFTDVCQADAFRPEFESVSAPKSTLDFKQVSVVHRASSAPHRKRLAMCLHKWADAGHRQLQKYQARIIRRRGDPGPREPVANPLLKHAALTEKEIRDRARRTAIQG